MIEELKDSVCRGGRLSRLCSHCCVLIAPDGDAPQSALCVSHSLFSYCGAGGSLGGRRGRPQACRFLDNAFLDFGLYEVTKTQNRVTTVIVSLAHRQPLALQSSLLSPYRTPRDGDFPLPVDDGRLRVELLRDEGGVDAVSLEEGCVRPDLGHGAAVEHDDLRGVNDGREAVRDEDDRLSAVGVSPDQVVERALDERLRLGVERRSGLVEQEEPRLAQQAAGDGEPLPLAAREALSALANLQGDMGRYGEIWGDMGRYGRCPQAGRGTRRER